MSALKITLFNTRKYSTLAMAESVASKQQYWVRVILGDDGLFWVAATNKEAGLLVKSGYEYAA